MSRPVPVWRIAAETRDREASDLSGTGSAGNPGRWNAAGEHVVYSSVTISLAVLETAAYVDAAGLPLDRFVVRIDLPPDLWDSREELDPAAIDPAWCAIPAGKSSEALGSAWFRSGKTAILLVPSVIVPEERNVLINASHPAAGAIKATKVRPFHYAPLFRN